MNIGLRASVRRKRFDEHIKTYISFCVGSLHRKRQQKQQTETENFMVYVFLADGFEEVEALTPVDLLRRAGAEVRTVGVGSKNITGAHGITVACNMSEDEAAESIKEAPEALEMTVLPGGMPGTLNLGKSGTVSHFLDAAAECGAFIGAICAAPSVLGAKGLLRGRRAVCYPGFEDKLTGRRSKMRESCATEILFAPAPQAARLNLRFALYPR